MCLFRSSHWLPLRHNIGIVFLLLSFSVCVADEVIELKGDLTQGGLVYGKTQGGAKVYLDGSRIRVSEQGDFIFGFGRDAKLRSILRIDLPDRKGQQKSLTITNREYDVQRITGLDANKVTPPPEMLSRIRKEGRLIVKARQIDDPRPHFLEKFQWPVQGVITGIYGSQRILNNQLRRPHYGIDIAAAKGTAVKAPASGVVTLVHPDMYFSGKTLVVDHGHGLSSTFLHLSEVQVKEGEQVRQGQVIAAVGSSGRSTGAHLDWRVNWFNQRLDPALLAGEMPLAEIASPAAK